MKMPKSSAQPCQACPLPVWWQKAAGPMVGYALDDTKWETAFHHLEKGRFWAVITFFLIFRSNA